MLNFHLNFQFILKIYSRTLSKLVSVNWEEKTLHNGYAKHDQDDDTENEVTGDELDLTFLRKREKH